MELTVDSGSCSLPGGVGIKQEAVCIEFMIEGPPHEEPLSPPPPDVISPGLTTAAADEPAYKRHAGACKSVASDINHECARR